MRVRAEFAMRVLAGAAAAQAACPGAESPVTVLDKLAPETLLAIAGVSFAVLVACVVVLVDRFDRWRW